MYSYNYLDKYSRQIKLIGIEGRKKLEKTSIAVIGVGGLGSMETLLLSYLGVGHIILVDYDKVDYPSLDRQVLHWEPNLGEPKVYSAASKIRKISPATRVEPIMVKATEKDLQKIVSRSDVVIDGLDNWEARLLVDRVSWSIGKPFIHAGVYGFHGQVIPILRGRTPCLRCIIENTMLRPTGTRATVTVAPVVALIASIAVLEALKIVTGIYKPLYGRMIAIDAASMKILNIKLPSIGKCTC